MTQITQPKALLSIGGFDPTGAAGVLLDAVASRSVGIHCAAICAVFTIQNGKQFVSSRPEDPQTLVRGIEAMFSTMGIGALKTGALGTVHAIEIISNIAVSNPALPLVIDPVIRSTSGGALLDDAGVASLRARLLRHATLVTPNVPEAELLTGHSISSTKDMLKSAKILVELGANAVLIKGGHLGGDEVHDIFLNRQGHKEIFTHPRNPKGDVRGTGCALASIVGALLTQGKDVLPSVIAARHIVRNAIRASQVMGTSPPILIFSSQKLDRS